MEKAATTGVATFYRHNFKKLIKEILNCLYLPFFPFYQTQNQSTENCTTTTVKHLHHFSLMKFLEYQIF